MPPPLPLPLGVDGLLDEASFEALSAGRGYLVFAQQPDARIDLAAWQRHATRHFGLELALTRPKRYGPSPPRTDAAHVVLSSPSAPAVLRSVFLRPRTDADLAAAERAQGGGGLALLARRCATVILVRAEGAPGAVDAAALRVAALLASVALGPVLTEDRNRILGARSAREEAEKLAAKGAE